VIFSVQVSAARTLLVSSFFCLGVGIPRWSAGLWLHFSVQCSCAPVCASIPCSRFGFPFSASTYLVQVSVVTDFDFLRRLIFVPPPDLHDFTTAGVLLFSSDLGVVGFWLLSSVAL
jgi:hypothetical protein